jgi:hypothetical protein
MDTIKITMCGFTFDTEDTKRVLVSAQKDLAKFSKKFGLECIIDDEIKRCDNYSSTYMYYGDITWYAPKEEGYAEMKNEIIDYCMNLLGDLNWYER